MQTEGSGAELWGTASASLDAPNFFRLAPEVAALAVAPAGLVPHSVFTSTTGAAAACAAVAADAIAVLATLP